MNFTFSSSEHGTCVVKLWATGRYGFSLPKKVDITTAAGVSCTFLYFNKKMSLKAEPGNRMIVRIAIGAFLAGAGRAGVPVEIDPEMAPFAGTLTPVRSMPGWMQPLTYVNPIRWYVECLRAALLKGAGFDVLGPRIAILAAMGFVALGPAVARFRRRRG